MEQKKPPLGSDVEAAVWVAPPPPQEAWISWLVPMFVLANVVMFGYSLYVNDCPSNHSIGSDCVLPSLGRFSFEPLSVNAFFGPSPYTFSPSDSVPPSPPIPPLIFTTEERNIQTTDQKAISAFKREPSLEISSSEQQRFELMAPPGRSMLYSLLLFIIILSLLEMYRGKLASSEWLTIVGGFISSLIFVVLLTFIGNYQESCGTRTGWGAVILAESIALVAASTVHRVCITTCFIFSAGFLYEINKLSILMLAKGETKAKRH